MRRMRMVKAPTTGRKVAYELIDATTDHGAAMYHLLGELVERRNPDVSHARFAMGWCTSWKGDVDGHVTVGKIRKASDLDKELAPYDFVMLLAKWFWEDVNVPPRTREAIIANELEKCALVYDRLTGEPKYDERGRPLFRLRKYDVQGFKSVVAEYGEYMSNIEDFAKALREAALRGFEPCAECKDSEAGHGWRLIDDGRTLKRCQCWLAWQRRCAAA